MIILIASSTSWKIFSWHITFFLLNPWYSWSPNQLHLQFSHSYIPHLLDHSDPWYNCSLDQLTTFCMQKFLGHLDTCTKQIISLNMQYFSINFWKLMLSFYFQEITFIGFFLNVKNTRIWCAELIFYFYLFQFQWHSAKNFQKVPMALFESFRLLIISGLLWHTVTTVWHQFFQFFANFWVKFPMLLQQSFSNFSTTFSIGFYHRKKPGFFFCGLDITRPRDKYFLVVEGAKKFRQFF